MKSGNLRPDIHTADGGFSTRGGPQAPDMIFRQPEIHQLVLQRADPGGITLSKISRQIIQQAFFLGPPMAP